MDHAPGGQRGDIVDVGEALVQRLAEHGIPAIQSKTIHDYPSFMKAYGSFEVTAKKMLEENPSIQMLFDIHRDAGKKEDYTAMVNGNSGGENTIIVATGQPGYEQPHWQQNYAFAKLLDAKLNQHYPGCHGESNLWNGALTSIFTPTHYFWRSAVRKTPRKKLFAAQSC